MSVSSGGCSLAPGDALPAAALPVADPLDSVGVYVAQNLLPQTFDVFVAEQLQPPENPDIRTHPWYRTWDAAVSATGDTTEATTSMIILGIIFKTIANPRFFADRVLFLKTMLDARFTSAIVRDALVTCETEGVYSLYDPEEEYPSAQMLLRKLCVAYGL
jgi:hypothetical protein